MRFALDSWAILSWLDGEEPAAGRVEEVLASQPFMNWVNLGEVFYILIRRVGEEEAERVIRSLRLRVAPDDAPAERVMVAARVKARHPMALAGALAISTAQAHRAVLLTGDPEILSVTGSWTTEDLRRRGRSTRNTGRQK